MAFAVLSLSQFVHSFNVRSEKPLIGHGLLQNRLLNLAFLVCAGLMAAVILFPSVAALFGAVSLTATQWMITALLSVLPLLLCEAEKRLLAEKKPKGRNKSGE